jgi:hypothetical protein
MPRICSALYGQVPLSIVSATFGFAEIARTLGDSTGVPSTISAPSQWNHVGTTRGVPSRETYATRTGVAE